MTDQPTTPTVDTDELRELLDRIETVSIAFTPAGEKGDEWTPSEPHREHRYDGRCAVCRFADYPEARAQVLTAALARPVPAAPAEPGATEVDDLIQKLRAASVHPEAFEPALYADAADALAALAALAAPPAPADEGRCRCGCTKAQHVGQSGRLGDPCRFCNTSGQGCPVGYLLAAPPAPAVPEERDEAVDEDGAYWIGTPAERLTGRRCQDCGGSGTSWDTLGEITCPTCDGSGCESEAHVLAARPAPVTAATTEEEAP